MKSSTLNPNLQSALKADKRFEALIKQEMTEHQRIISSHHKEMQSLKDALNNSLDKFHGLFNHSETQLTDNCKTLKELIEKLQEKVKHQEVISFESKNAINSLYQELYNLYDIFSKISDLQRLKEDISNQIKETNFNQLNAFQTYQQEVKSLFSYLKDDLVNFKSEMKDKFFDLVNHVEHRLNHSKMDKESVLAELRAYKKSMFIIEKKVENIYTLIDRINQRGDACHKQV